MITKKAVVLFSGGLDSTTCLAIAKSQGYDCYALTFSYGQKHSVECEHAKRMAKHYAVKDHKVLTLPVEAFQGSSLTDQKGDVPDYAGESGGLPSTYVPARNTIFLAFALGWADLLEANAIFIGANQVDYSGYPDCREDFLRAFEEVAKQGTRRGVEGHAVKVISPLLHLSKAQIIQWGMALGVDYSQTISCYRANEKGQACGKCDSCVYRKRGFEQAKIVDPTAYHTE